MIQLDRDIESLSNFKRRTSHFLKKMRKSGQPMVLTVNGKAQMVVQDAASYQTLLDAIEQVKTMEAIRLGIQQIQEGKKLPLDKALAEIKRNLGISRKS